MRHVEKALLKLIEQNPESEYQSFVNIENAEDVKGVSPVVKFTIQSDPIGEVGVNGVQAVDVLKYVKCLFESLNESYQCRENILTIDQINNAIHFQEERTKDRQRRGVEGKNQK